MSQKTVFIVLIAIILVVNHADSKRVGCASFGHSCYGGFGKRSPISPTSDSIQQMDMAGEHNANLIPIPMKTFQRHIQFRTDTQQNEMAEQEKELKIILLNTLSQIIDDTVKKVSSDYESN